MATKFNATVEAVQNADNWMNGAVVLKLSNGEYEAYPKAHLSDISFTEEYDEIAVDLSNGLETATGYSLNDATAEEIAELLLQ